MFRKILSMLFLIAFPLTSLGSTVFSSQMAQAQPAGASLPFSLAGVDQADPQVDEQIEQAWHPAYLALATGDPGLTDHGVYAWPFALDSIGWSMQSYQDYGGTPYFHHGMDMMKIFGTNVFNRSGGQVINIENYQPGSELYWEVAILDPYGYIWQYHHISEPTIPQYIWDKYYEYLANPETGGFIPADTYIGDIIEWPVWSFGKQFNHIHLNILAAGGVFVNGFEFHNPLPDTVGPEVQGVGLLQNGQVYPGNTIEGDYSLYVRAHDLILDDVYYLPPWEITFSVDGGPVETTWRFDTLPGGASDTAYLDDFYVVPPTCGDYYCRDYYIDLGFIPGSQYVFPITGGQHSVQVRVADYAGNFATQVYTYSVIGPPAGVPVWQDDFETDRGWIPNPDGSDTATLGQWERDDPQGTFSGGPKQLGTTPSGTKDLVTGHLAGSSANSYDIDGGITSIRSPQITLPSDGDLVLSFRYYLAHGTNSSSADFLSITVVSTDTLKVFEEQGSTTNDNGDWAIENVSINSFAGQAVYLLVEAADNASDSLVEAAIDNVLIVSTDQNHAPVADPQSAATLEDTPVDLTLTGSDQDGDPLSFDIVSGPAHGRLSGSPPNVTYIPALNYFGSDSFSFHAYDGQVSSEPAIVSIAIDPVNDAPVASPQPVSTFEDTPLDILLKGSDVDGDPLTYTVVTTPSHGLLTGVAPAITYLPNANYSGVDSFKFIVSDGQLASAPATVGITVRPVNDAPVADPQSVRTPTSTAVDITLHGSDIEGDNLTYQVVVYPGHGTLYGVAPSLTYLPEPGYAGGDSFSFIVNDGKLDSAEAIVEIRIGFLVYAPIILR